MASVNVVYADVIELLEHLGEIVKHEREERGLSLRAAADEIGMSYTHLWGIEYDSAEAGIGVAVKLVRWLANA